jgi:hypothetical protein
MLGTIEELEKDIELFQQNMAASGELQALLRQMLEQIKKGNMEFEEQSSALITRVDNLPTLIENANISSNNRVKNDVATEIDKALQSFANEQGKYLQVLEQSKKQIQIFMEQSNVQEKAFADGTTSALAKFDESVKRINDDNIKSKDALRADIDKLLENRNKAFVEEQSKYISSLQQTQNEIKSCESLLNVKYSEFVDTLQKMNISNLYDQNIQLKNELNKRTTILMVISIISIIVGLVGMFLR